ncbi:MAG: alpha/beta fold hydrolase [Aeriscardovia sp.]|nr:alpha/beta fold hydrolase [Aeriscardovia sp.]
MGPVVSGIQIEEESLEVPLDWRGLNPKDEKEVENRMGEEKISISYKVLKKAGSAKRSLGPLIYFQGGPGEKCPRPLGINSCKPWIKTALDLGFEVVLPDQRGVGNSSPITPSLLLKRGGAKEQADYLKRFLARSISCDMEWIRLKKFEGQKWTSLGQSFGGFITMSCLSFFPHSFSLCFTTGGIPKIPSDIDKVYEKTYERLEEKNEKYFETFPKDRDLVCRIADRISSSSYLLPNGDKMSVERLQSLGQQFGMSTGFASVHWMMDEALEGSGLSENFLRDVWEATSSYGSELYWTLQEAIYMNGDGKKPGWEAEKLRNKMPQFSSEARPLLFTGEMNYKWRFEQDRALVPFKDAEDALEESEEWDPIFSIPQLRENPVPLYAMVYFNDMYVPREWSVETLKEIGNSHSFVTSEFEHDGIRVSNAFEKILDLAVKNGDAII